MGLTRRDFITGAAVGAVGLGLAGCSPQTVQADAGDTTQEAGYSFETPTDPITKIAETINADVVVVGGGTSGLCCAAAAAEEGLSVALVSASKAPVSRGGSNHAAYSKVMEKAGVSRYDVDWVFRKELLVGQNTADQRKWYRFYNESEKVMNWAIDLAASYGMDCVLEQTTELPATDPYYAPYATHNFINAENPVPGLGQPGFVKGLADYLEKKGGTIYWQNIGRQLVRGGQPNGTFGRVEALIAEREDGTYAQYNASKAVVLATGDFSKDKEMMEKYCPYVLPLLLDMENINYDIGMSTGSLMPGDGHKMGLWVGAAWQNSTPNAAMISGNGATAFCNHPYMGHTGLMVNKKGERYSNEFAPGSLSNRAALSQPEGKAYMIWGQNYLEANAPWPAYPAAKGTPPITNDAEQAIWDKSVSGGAWIKCDTLEELLEKLGLPKEETLATISRYNELCKKGTDEDFHKQSKYMVPINTPPYYGFLNTVRFLTICGGLRTDQYMHVCDESEAPIPGLYNVGTMVGDMFTGQYTFMMEGANYGACCVTFGYLTGKYIAKNE